VIRRLPLLLLAAVLIAAGVLGASAAAERAALTPPNAASLADDVQTLTAPEMDGRASGSAGGDRAAREIAGWLRATGLRPGGDHGTFLHSFALSAATTLAAGNAFDLLGPVTHPFTVDQDWRPHGGSLAGQVTGGLAFVGHGLVSPDGTWDEYRGVDVRGKLVLALDGAPPHLGARATTRLEKLIAARRRGAAALLTIGDDLPALAATGVPVRIVSAAITRAAADAVLRGALSAAGRTTRDLERAIADRRMPASFVLPVEARLRVALGREDRRAANVVAILPGSDPDLAREAVVVGAHYDHLGRIDGELYPGADDNASGTAVVVGLARAFAAAPPPARTLVFALFGAEEAGLLGSRHYVLKPPVPIERTAVMINLDMVGRMRDGRVIVSGVQSGRGLEPIVAEAARAEGVRADVRGGPHSPSDHVRFYRAGTPVLSVHTGRHEDYHRPTDTADRINPDGMARVAAVVRRVIEALAAGPRPGYVTVPPPRGDQRAGSVFFGIVAGPHLPGDGLRLADVVPQSAAERAGLAEGDVIVRFAGRPVDGFEDLRGALADRKPGETVEVVYLRDGEDRTVTATLGAHP
jgi:hypothetical protein